MSVFFEFLTNKVFVSIFLTFFICSILKFIINSGIYRRVHWSSWYDTGGMPSVHSASVTSLVLSIALFDNINSIVFIASLVFGIIVVRDAIGVRHTVDKLILCVNQIISSRKININHIKTIAGHTPLQVLMGVLVGIIVPLIYYSLVRFL